MEEPGQQVEDDGGACQDSNASPDPHLVVRQVPLVKDRIADGQRLACQGIGDEFILPSGGCKLVDDKCLLCVGYRVDPEKPVGL